MRFLLKIPIEYIDLDRRPTYYRSIRNSGFYSYKVLVKAALLPA